MTINKLTSNVQPLSVVSKTNEIIDNGGGGGEGKAYSTTNAEALTPVSGVCTWNVTHNLGTTDIVCSLYANNAEIQADITTTSSNAIAVQFNASGTVSAGSVKIVILASGGVQPVEIDNSLSSTSENPVQNKVITGALAAISYSAFTGADGTSAGTSGLVPAPTATDNTKVLKGDGTWGTLGGKISTTPTNEFPNGALSGFGWTATDNGVVVFHNGGSTSQIVCCVIANTYIGFLDNNFAANDVHTEMVFKGATYWIVRSASSVTAHFHKFI